MVLTKSVVFHLNFRRLLVNLRCLGQRYDCHIKSFRVVVGCYLHRSYIHLSMLDQIVKQLWVYIRKHNLQDPGNKRKIICNDALRAVFETDCTDMFKMNKLLAKHITALDPSSMSNNIRFFPFVTYLLLLHCQKVHSK